MDKKGKKKRKLKISGLIVILLVIYLIAMSGYYLFTMPIKSITVVNNDTLKEKDIIDSADLSLETPIFKVITSSPRKKIEKLPLIKEAHVKIGLNGEVTIEVKENKILFLNALDDEIVLEGGGVIPNDNSYKGIPILINYVSSQVYKNFIIAFSKIDEDIIKMISEIEYDPDEYNGITLDEERFLLRMNDGNLVYINNVNIEKLNKYQEIYASVGSGGILYLDSSSENYIFNLLDENGNIIDNLEGEQNE